jgi:hypothetical protein
MILARSHAPRHSLQAIHCAVEGMDAKRSAAVLLSSPAARSRAAVRRGAGLDSSAVAEHNPPRRRSRLAAVPPQTRLPPAPPPFDGPSALSPNLHSLDGHDRSHARVGYARSGFISGCLGPGRRASIRNRIKTRAGGLRHGAVAGGCARWICWPPTFCMLRGGSPDRSANIGV